MLGQFASSEVRPISGAGEAFPFGRAEVELHRDLSFADGGMLFQVEAVLQFHLRLRQLIEVGNIHTTLVDPGDRKWQ